MKISKNNTGSKSNPIPYPEELVRDLIQAQVPRGYINSLIVRNANAFNFVQSTKIIQRKISRSTPEVSEGVIHTLTMFV